MPDHQTYEAQFRFLDPVKKEQIARLLDENKLAIRQTGKGEYLLRQNQKCNSIDFILKGCFRQFSLQNGEEINFLFYFEKEFIIDHNSYLSDTPTIYNIQAIEDSTTLNISKKVLNELSVHDESWLKLYSKINEIAIVRLYKRNEVLLTQTPEQRYLKLLEVHPHIMERVSLARIATFLGITVPSLSRIRKRIAEQT